MSNCLNHKKKTKPSELGGAAKETVSLYIDKLIPPLDHEMESLRTYAQKNQVPIIDRDVARFLQQLIGMNKVRRILEIGTAIGYSALLFAKAMEKGHIHTVEKNPFMVEQAKKNVLKSPKNVDIQVFEGDGRNLEQIANGFYDMVFIDGAKGQYMAFLEAALPYIKQGGIVVSDNVFFKGLVVTPRLLVPRRQRTIHKRMGAYLEYLMSNPHMDTSLLPLGDGVAVTILKSGGFYEKG